MFGGDGSGALERAGEEVLECRRCDLWRSGARSVFGSGPTDAELMLLGEAPSEADLRTGEPFSGPSGELLDEWIEALGLSRERVWLTNTVKHRPTVEENGREKNRPPRASESKACRVWLDIELEQVAPRLVLALGGSAGKSLLGKDFRITQHRGIALPGPSGVPIVATFHPAYLLRLESPELEEAQQAVRDDLGLVRDLLARR